MPEKENAEAAHEKISIRNFSRQSLHVHVPGGALRVSPGETAELPRAYLNTPELRSLCKQGQLAEVRSGATRKKAAGEGKEKAAPAGKENAAAGDTAAEPAAARKAEAKAKG